MEISQACCLILFQQIWIRKVPIEEYENWLFCCLFEYRGDFLKKKIFAHSGVIHFAYNRPSQRNCSNHTELQLFFAFSFDIMIVNKYNLRPCTLLLLNSFHYLIQIKELLELVFFFQDVDNVFLVEILLYVDVHPVEHFHQNLLVSVLWIPLQIASNQRSLQQT